MENFRFMDPKFFFTVSQKPDTETPSETEKPSPYPYTEFL
jgi:hypothetical protein